MSESMVERVARALESAPTVSVRNNKGAATPFEVFYMPDEAAPISEDAVVVHSRWVAHDDASDAAHHLQWWVCARAAIEAHLAALSEQGMVIVPREPSKEMLHAACKALSPGRRPTPEFVSVREKHTIRYKAMIAALSETETP